MKEVYKFLVVSTGHKDKDLREKLRNIDRKAKFHYRSTQRNSAMDLVQEMLDYDYKGIVVVGNIPASYAPKLFRYSAKNEVHEKIYIVQDGKLASLWDVSLGDAKEYATELI